MKEKNEYFSDILQQVKKLNYSNENILEIISLFYKSINIAKNFNTSRSQNPCLNALLNTKDKEFENLISKETNEEERKEAFREFKTNFIMDLSMNCV